MSSVKFDKNKVWFLCHFDNPVKDLSGHDLDTFIDETENNEILRADRNRDYGWSTFTETTGKFNKAFVSSNYSLEINDLSDFPADAFTVSFWAQNKGVDETNGNLSQNGVGYAFLIRNLVGLRRYYNSLRIDDIMSGNKSWKNLSNDRWDHFAIQYNENKLYYYFNGDLYHTINVTKSFTLDKIFFASALIDELMIYDGLLYDTDVTVGTHVFDPPTEPYSIAHEYVAKVTSSKANPIEFGRDITLSASLYDKDIKEYISGTDVNYLWSTGETSGEITVRPTERTRYTVSITHKDKTYDASYIVSDTKKEFLDKEGLQELWEMMKAYMDKYYVRKETDEPSLTSLGELGEDLNDIVNEDIDENPRSEVNSN